MDEIYTLTFICIYAMQNGENIGILENGGHRHGRGHNKQIAILHTYIVNTVN